MIYASVLLLKLNNFVRMHFECGNEDTIMSNSHSVKCNGLVNNFQVQSLKTYLESVLLKKNMNVKMLTKCSVF